MNPHYTDGAPVEDQEAPPSVRDAASIIERQRAVAAAGIVPDGRLLYGIWGAAWLLGFGAFFAVTAQLVDAPLWLAGLVFFVLLIAASAISGLHLSGRARGVRGRDSVIGAMYGFSWLIGMVALGAFLAGTANLGMSDAARAALFGGAFPLLVGVLYLAGGAIWRDRFQYAMGAWIILVAAVSPFLGVPGNYLVLALAGGGGLLAAAGFFAVRGARRGR